MSKETSPRVAKLASKQLKQSKSKPQKAVAASALSQVERRKTKRK